MDVTNSLIRPAFSTYVHQQVQPVTRFHTVVQGAIETRGLEHRVNSFNFSPSGKYVDIFK